MNWDKEPIKVNKIIGKQAGFGPIPANQILPWFAIITITYFIFDGLLSWGIPKVAVISFWLIRALVARDAERPSQINTLIFFANLSVIVMGRLDAPPESTASRCNLDASIRCVSKRPRHYRALQSGVFPHVGNHPNGRIFQY